MSIYSGFDLNIFALCAEALLGHLDFHRPSDALSVFAQHLVQRGNSPVITDGSRLSREAYFASVNMPLVLESLLSFIAQQQPFPLSSLFSPEVQFPEKILYQLSPLVSTPMRSGDVIRFCKFSFQSEFFGDYQAIDGSADYNQKCSFLVTVKVEFLLPFSETLRIFPFVSKKTHDGGDVPFDQTEVLVDGENWPSALTSEPTAVELGSESSFTVSINAGDYMDPMNGGGMSCPPLRLAVHFDNLYAGSVTVYPDLLSIERATSDYTESSLEQLRGFPTTPSGVGPPMLPKGYQGTSKVATASREALANALNNVGKPELPSKRSLAALGAIAIDARSSRFSTLTVSHANEAAAPLGWSKKAEQPNIWSLAFDAKGMASWKTAASLAEARSHVRTHHLEHFSLDTDSFQKEEPLGGFWESIKNFFKAIVNAVKKITAAIVEIVGEAVKVIIYAGEKIAEWTTVAASAIAGVVVSVFKVIVSVAKVAFEALTIIFHWNDYMKLKDAIRGIVENTLKLAPAATKALGKSILGPAKDFRAQAQKYFQDIIDDLGSKSINDADKDYPESSNMLDNSGAEGNYLNGKLAADVNKEQRRAAAARRLGQKYVPFSSWEVAEATLLDIDLSNIIDGVFNFLTVMTKALAESSATSWDGLFDVLLGAFGSLWDLISSGKVKNTAMSNLVSGIQKIVDAVLGLFISGTQAIFAMIEVCFTIITAVVSAPIHIPFISWLYKKLTKKDLSILDLTSLLLSLPLGVITRALIGDMNKTTNALLSFTSDLKLVKVPDVLTNDPISSDKLLVKYDRDSIFRLAISHNVFGYVQCVTSVQTKLFKCSLQVFEGDSAPDILSLQKFYGRFALVNDLVKFVRLGLTIPVVRAVGDIHYMSWLLWGLKGHFMVKVPGHILCCAGAMNPIPGSPKPPPTQKALKMFLKVFDATSTICETALFVIRAIRLFGWVHWQSGTAKYYGKANEIFNIVTMVIGKALDQKKFAQKAPKAWFVGLVVYFILRATSCVVQSVYIGTELAAPGSLSVVRLNTGASVMVGLGNRPPSYLLA